MTRRGAVDTLRALERSLNESTAEAERLLPELLDLPASTLRSAFEQHPEMRTAAMMQCLLDVAHDALERFPDRAHALTSVVVAVLPSVSVSGVLTFIGRTVHGKAWIEHARALRGIGELAEAHRAIARARELFDETSGKQWFLALVDLVEAPILHDLGARDEGLAMIRRAAQVIEPYRDYKCFVEARLIETAMLWQSGDRAGATALWPSTADGAQLSGDPTLKAHVESAIGLLHLRHGEVVTAAEMLVSAVKKFDAEGLRRDAARARCHLAEALDALGRVHEAISELHKARGALIVAGNIAEAALVSVSILDLLLAAGREHELPVRTETFVADFQVGLTQNALDAFNYLRAYAAAGELTREGIAAVRRYLEDLRQRPNHVFEPPD